MREEEVWEGDTDVSDDWNEPVQQEPRRLRRIGQAGPQRRGNVKRGEEGQARRAAVAEATGKAEPSREPWREQMALGDRDGAASTIASGKLTHNAGSGFGLATPRRRGRR